MLVVPRSNRARLRPAATALLLLALAAPAGAQDDLLEGQEPVLLPDISVSDDATRATVDGRTDSLKATVEELCRQAEIELRAYGAPDRPTRTRYRDMDVRDLFERMLWQENFLLGTSPAEDGSSRRIAWLQVLGGEGGGSGGGASGGGGIISSGGSNDGVRELVMPRTGYTTRSATIRRRTAEAFAKRLDEDAEARRRFLATPDAKYVEVMKKETYSIAFLNELTKMVNDRPAKLKIERLNRTLQRARDE